jgi:hypothetical protein
MRSNIPTRKHIINNTSKKVELKTKLVLVSFVTIELFALKRKMTKILTLFRNVVQKMRKKLESNSTGYKMTKKQ